MSKVKKTKYRVYFSQVNATYIDVVAVSQQQAIDRASTKWTGKFPWPIAKSVEELPEK